MTTFIKLENGISLFSGKENQRRFGWGEVPHFPKGAEMLKLCRESRHPLIDSHNGEGIMGEYDPKDYLHREALNRAQKILASEKGHEWDTVCVMTGRFPDISLMNEKYYVDNGVVKKASIQYQSYNKLQKYASFKEACMAIGKYRSLDARDEREFDEELLKFHNRELNFEDLKEGVKVYLRGI